MKRIFASAFSILLLGLLLESARAQAPSGIVTASVGITLDSARQVFHLDSADAMGLRNVPDMHTCVVRQTDSSYNVYITGVVGVNGDGSTALLSTRDFLKYQPVVGTRTHAAPVFGPSCPGHPGTDPSCWNNYDADYAGANLVFTASNGKDLLMLYHAEERTFGSGPPNSLTPSWAVLGLARSTDNGASWTREGPVVSGADPKPATNPSNAAVLGVVEPGAIIADGYIYAYYAYFPNPDAADAGPPSIQVARAPVSGDGAPGSWTKYYNGAFGAEPGLGGRGSPIITSAPGNSRQAQPWPAFSRYLNAFILVFIDTDGWFFSTSQDLVTWSPPINFFNLKLFQACQPNDDNVVFVTPGNAGQVLDRTGYVLYAHTPHWGFKNCPAVEEHELWIRPFTFSKGNTDMQVTEAPLPKNEELDQNYPNPFNPATTISFRIPTQTFVSLKVFDALGREVSILLEKELPAGSYVKQWDAEELPSGNYFYRLQAGSFTETRKLILQR
jgi:hypothetical protein